MEALEAAFDCARVDSGYPKHLDPDKPAGMTHADNKEWALRTAPAVAAERGMALPTSVSDDACDALLQGVWWLEKHTPSALDCMECDDDSHPG